MARVRFGRDFGTREVAPGTTLLAAAARAQAPLGNACRAQGVCRACAVLVVRGEAALTPPGPLELAMALEPPWRMACQARITSQVRIANTEPNNERAELVLWTPNWGGDPSQIAVDPDLP